MTLLTHNFSSMGRPPTLPMVGWNQIDFKDEEYICQWIDLFLKHKTTICCITDSWHNWW